MIKPDKEAAIKKIQYLHTCLYGVQMCCQHSSPAYDLAIVLQGELRQVLRLLGDDDDD